MSKLYAILLFVIGSVWFAGSVSARAVANSTVGTCFLIGAVNNANASVSNITIVINSAGRNNATILSPGIERISVPSFNGTTSVVLPGSLIPNLQGNASLGIFVKTENVSTVQAFVNNSVPNGGEGTLIFPIETLGKTYFINGETPNGAFTVVSTSNDSTSVEIRFRNNTVSYFTLRSALDTLSFSGPGLDGALINTDSIVAVFAGRDCSSTPDPNFRNSSVCGYLWEQMVRIEKFGRDFVLVNPNAPLEDDNSNDTITTIRLVSGLNIPVFVSVSGLTEPFPIRLVQGQAVAIETRNLTNVINATGPIDVQIITQSSKFENRTQWGLIPNDQFVDQARFFVNSSASSQLSLVARTSDVKNSSSRLTFNGARFDLGQFKVSANSSYSYAIMKPKQGANFMDATFKLGGYLFEFKANATNFGSIIGRNL